MGDRIFRQDLLDEMKNMPVIDTHEHLESEETRITRKIDPFNVFMMHYASSDLVSSGMPAHEMNFLKSEDDNLDKKWSIFKPYWEKARNTTYCKGLLIATKEIYGFDDIDDSTYRPLDAAMKKANRKGLYKIVLKDKCGIEKSLMDVADEQCDPEYFQFVKCFDELIQLRSKKTILDVESKHGLSISSLNDWVAAIRKIVSEYKAAHGIPSIKSCMAYLRTLEYERTDRSVAESLFNRILTSKDFDGTFYHPVNFDVKPLEDYLMHALIQTASELNLSMQIHTGLQEGNGNLITRSNPVKLANLFMEYPRVKFDIFHASYPYGGELCTLAKNFQNVYVDLCWAHVISREYTIRFIEELLDTVPANKVFGFGGDYCFVEGVLGHLTIAKENIAIALANKEVKGFLSKEECRTIAHRMLYDNAKEFFAV
jgi:predicted TIM-barrel fold metal-dependent hydrolase